LESVSSESGLFIRLTGATQKHIVSYSHDIFLGGMIMKKIAWFVRSIPVFIISSLLMVCFSVSAYAFALPDTGQTKCYQGVSPYAEIPCAGTGQDGAYNINPVNYTDNGNGTVTDNNTGLMWQKQGDGTTRTWDAAVSYCVSLGTDWRLPTEKELITIVDYSIPYPGPMINPVFTGTPQYSFYWSSSTFLSGYPYGAWAVGFDGGYVYGYFTGNDGYVRCVRGDQALTQNFVDNGNGTVTDNNTGLMWQQGEPGAKTWDSALSYCENLILPSSGYSDWRLPNITELESITDDTVFDPVNHPIAIDTNAFPNANASNYYWSSTTSAVYPSGAWLVYFHYGGNYGYGSKDSDMYVRCVRGGEGPPSQPCIYTYSDWGTCHADGTQTRTVISATPDGCTGTPVLSQSCTPFGNLEVSPPSPYDFGTIKKDTQSAPQEVTLSNTGSGDINVSNISVSDTTNYLLLYGGSAPCLGTNFTLIPGNYCTVIIKFNPTTKGNLFATLTVTSNDPDTPTFAVSLSGTTLKSEWGWIVTIDGMNMWSTFLSPWADSSTNYLNKAIDQTTDPKRTQIEQDKGKIVGFTWNGDILYTDFYVEKLYEYLKKLNDTNRPVVILSHSWGTVLSYIALTKHSDIHVDKLITLGSPLNADDPLIFMFTVEQLLTFGLGPVYKPTNVKEWNNYYTECDNIGGDILALSSRDNYVNKTYYPNRRFPNPFDCHSSYFDDRNKWDKILKDVIKK